jgi:proline dehydrogenase
VDYTRYLVEAEEQGRKDIPFSVVMKLGEIPFMRQDVIARVRGTFEQQRARLVKLTGVRLGEASEV